jgi:zinc protease
MSRLCSLLATLVVLFGLAPAAGATEVLIPYTEYTLDNGLRLIVHQDTKAPIVAVNVWYHVGSKNEEPGKTGFAHLFEHLMFNGSENHDDEYFKPFERVGATDQNGTTGQDRTNYFQNVPKTAVDMALWMESDRMGHLLGAVTQEKLDEQRGVVQNEKRQRDNQPYGKVWYSLFEGVFPEGHPYSWLPIGSMADLDAASLEDVQNWFKTYYGPNNAVIVVAGDITPEEALAKVQKYFGDIPPGPPIAKFDAWEVRLPQDKYEVMQDRVPQARYYKAWGGPRVTAPDYDQLELAAAVLGQGKNSRLYERLVYKDQIATSASAFVYGGEIAGFFMVSVEVQPGGDLEQVKRAVDEEIERLMTGGIRPEELERVKTGQRAGFVRGVERVGGFGGKSDVLASGAVYAGDPGFYRTGLARLDAATPASVREAMGRWLTAGAYHLDVLPFPELKASGPGADRSAVPATASFPAASFDAFERTTLSNGLKLVVAPRHAVPVVDMQLVLDAGFAADQFGEAGTAKLAMAMLDEGTKTRSALQISEELARLGANLGAGGSLDTSSVTLSALKEHLDKSLELYADVVLNPSFPDSELERLRKQALAGIQQEKTSPRTMALRTMPALLYGEGHAYSNPLTGSGTEESVRRITRQALVDYHGTWFKPNNATLVVVGDTTMAEIRPKLEKAFGRWQAGEVPRKNLAPVPARGGERVFLIDRPGAEQSIILAGDLAPPMGGMDEAALETMNEILGGSSVTGRLGKNLREDKSWSYGAFSFIADAKGQRPFIAYAPVQTDKTKESMAEIRKELSGIVSDRPVTAEELDTAKATQTLSLPGRWETAGAVMGDLSDIVVFGLPDDYWNRYADAIRAVSATQVMDAAKEAIRPGALTWVVVGDRAKVEAGIRELGLGEIAFIDGDGKPVAN